VALPTLILTRPGSPLEEGHLEEDRLAQGASALVLGVAVAILVAAAAIVVMAPMSDLDLNPVSVPMVKPESTRLTVPTAHTTVGQAVMEEEATEASVVMVAEAEPDLWVNMARNCHLT